MTYHHQRTVQQHPWSGIPHHFSDSFLHQWCITFCCALRTKSLCGHMRTMCNTCQGIFLQFSAFFTKHSMICFMLSMAVNFYHPADCLFFFFPLLFYIHTYQHILPFSTEYTVSEIHIVDFL